MCKGPRAPKQYGTQLPRELFQLVVNEEAGTESYSSREHGKPVYHEALGYNAILKHSFLSEQEWRMDCSTQEQKEGFALIVLWKKKKNDNQLAPKLAAGKNTR